MRPHPTSRPSPARRALLSLGLGVLLGGHLVGLLVACAARARGPDEPPPDFALGLSVRGEARTPLAPAWYILDADGVLRAGLGVRHERTPAPVPVRTLRADERAEVWRLTDALRTDDLGVASPGAVPAPGEGVLHLTRDGRRRTYLVADAGSRDDLARLAARLGALAWARPETPGAAAPDATIAR